MTKTYGRPRRQESHLRMLVAAVVLISTLVLCGVAVTFISTSDRPVEPGIVLTTPAEPR